jgi:bacillopeptidase F
MKERTAVFVLILATALSGGTITRELETILRATASADRIPVILQTREQAELSGLPAPADYHDRFGALKTTAEQAQRRILDCLSSAGASDIRSFWLVSRVAFKAVPAVIREIAGRDDVAFIMDDYAIAIDNLPSLRDATDLVEWGISRVRADSCWLEGYDGAGVVIGNMDTGVEVTHPAFGGRWRAANGWFDAVSGGPTPYDDNGHGTMTMGTLTGGDGLGPAGDDIGVAPGCSLICAKVFDAGGAGQMSWIMAGFDWMAGTGRPAVCLNCWGTGSRTDTTWARYVRNLRDLGIVAVFAAGSGGPGDSTSTPPGSFPMCLSSGATDADDNIASFTGRGPAPNLPPWNVPSEWPRADWNLINPAIAAPGVNIRSAYPGGGYQIYSGSSMATPHVAGAAALLLQKNPSLAYPEIFTLITDNADHPSQGGNYPNNRYGWGRLNCKRALDGLPTGLEEAPERSQQLVCSGSPNPFHESFTIRYELENPGDVTIAIHDVSGRPVLNTPLGHASRGPHRFTWHSAAVAPGIYFVSVRTPSGAVCRKMVKAAP